ncbi:hypothetical protein MSAN_00771900 [Mycena sanguinolenta]|uniref:Uncharacterized protein n=1 Tax=Mycena sanguinolenta TaxID=230812 RepID=A0A8H6Z2D7_9AGAR|nr:hypothetical protein MSAN_00771900 [Mycena sanguinolenta]
MDSLSRRHFQPISVCENLWRNSRMDIASRRAGPLVLHAHLPRGTDAAGGGQGQESRDITGERRSVSGGARVPAAHCVHVPGGVLCLRITGSVLTASRTGRSSPQLHTPLLAARVPPPPAPVDSPYASTAHRLRVYNDPEQIGVLVSHARARVVCVSASPKNRVVAVSPLTHALPALPRPAVPYPYPHRRSAHRGGCVDVRKRSRARHIPTASANASDALRFCTRCDYTSAPTLYVARGKVRVEDMDMDGTASPHVGVTTLARCLIAPLPAPRIA